jgi:epoxyqueuosine reductase
LVSCGAWAFILRAGQGSYQLLGEVVTTLVLKADTPIAERCDHASRAASMRPTSRSSPSFVLDPRGAFPYLTIEQREAPPEELREAIGQHLFGCDDCQTCARSQRAAAPSAEKTRRLRPSIFSRWSGIGSDDLVGLDEAAWNEVGGAGDAVDPSRGPGGDGAQRGDQEGEPAPARSGGRRGGPR